MRKQILMDKIKNSGLKMNFIAMNSGMTRESLFNKINGKTEFKASEIVALTELLNLSKAERDYIFLNIS